MFLMKLVQPFPLTVVFLEIYMID